MCTEKDYSGTIVSKIMKNAKSAVAIKENFDLKLEKKNKVGENTDIGNLKNYLKAGEIAKKVKEYARTKIKKNEKLVDIAEKIESKILELGGEIAFPVNLSLDDVAAHYTPTLHDEKTAQGLLKVDIGIHIKGCICDFAFSLDLTPEKKHATLIQASENALKAALEFVKKERENSTFDGIGKSIQEEIQKLGFSPIRNLSGHSLGEFQVHAGFTVPNYANGNFKTITGAFAIEPFATSGTGIVYDGGASNIYYIIKQSQPRDTFARQVFKYIAEVKKFLPFSQRELEKKFGTRVLFAIKTLKVAGIIKEYPQLVEQNHMPVSQAETSVVIENGNVYILV